MLARLLLVVLPLTGCGRFGFATDHAAVDAPAGDDDGLVIDGPDGLVIDGPAIDGMPPMVDVMFVPGGWGSNHDIAFEGSLDWVYWGHGGLAAVDRRVGGDEIGDWTHLGGGALYQEAAASIDTFDWTGGTPTATATGVSDLIFVDTGNPSGDGFEIVVSAKPIIKFLTLYVGNWCVRARLEAMLDDGTPASVDTAWDVQTPRGEIGRYNILYSTPTGSALTLRFTVDHNYCTSGDIGELWIMAATLHT